MKTKINKIKYGHKIVICPFLSTSTNNCSKKKVGKCIYSKNVKKCPLYKQWFKAKKSYEDSLKPLKSITGDEDGL